MKIDILKNQIEKANAKNRAAVIPFLTAGFPDIEKFWELLFQLDKSCADIIEIGVPFSDPVADGIVIERASKVALNNGITLDLILSGLIERKEQLQKPIILMGYYNPFLQYGLSNLVKKAKAANIAGFIIPDLPLEEDTALRELCNDFGLALIPFVGINTSPERMKMYNMKNKSGFVYVVSIMGITGTSGSLGKTINKTLETAKSSFDFPVALGFGIKFPKQIEELTTKPNAVVIGSALLQHIENGGNIDEFMKIWE